MIPVSMLPSEWIFQPNSIRLGGTDPPGLTRPIGSVYKYVAGEGIVRGNLVKGKLHGKVSIQDFSESSKTELMYR